MSIICLHLKKKCVKPGNSKELQLYNLLNVEGMFFYSCNVLDFRNSFPISDSWKLI